VAVDERNLSEGVRYALSLEMLMSAEGIDALALNDVIPEMHACFGLRPCLWNHQLSARGAVIAMEADIAAVIAMYILRSATGTSPFYAEPVSVDWKRNQVLLGHAGYHDAANADPAVPTRIIADVEYENSDRFTGAATYFKYRAGQVTLINSVWDGQGLGWTCLQGESLPGPAKVQGICHLMLAPDVPVRSFILSAINRGVSQHWIVVPGRLLAEMKVLCRMIGISFTAISD
jgi:L-fucose isomerase-like protein